MVALLVLPLFGQRLRTRPDAGDIRIFVPLSRAGFGTALLCFHSSRLFVFLFLLSILFLFSFLKCWSGFLRHNCSLAFCSRKAARLQASIHACSSSSLLLMRLAKLSPLKSSSTASSSLSP